MENVLFKDITQKKGYSRQLCISVNFYRCNNTSAAAGGRLLLLSLVSVFPSHYLFFSLCRCLIRLVDDFLLITPDLHDAQAFLKYDTRQVCHTTAHVTQGLSTNMCFGLIHNIFTFQISWLFWTFRKSIINYIIIHTWDEAFSSRDCRRSQMHFDHLNLLSLTLIGSHLFVAVKLLLEGNCCNIIWCSCRTQHKYI